MSGYSLLGATSVRLQEEEVSYNAQQNVPFRALQQILTGTSQVTITYLGKYLGGLVWKPRSLLPLRLGTSGPAEVRLLLAGGPASQSRTSGRDFKLNNASCEFHSSIIKLRFST